MANYGNMYITNKGKMLYAKAQAGAELHFTKAMLGSGVIGTQNPETLLALIDPKLDASIQGITTNPEKQQATISILFNNSTITDATYLCEIGLFAQDPDEGEILYAYASAGTYGDYMAPATSGAYSWNYQLIAAIGNASNVTVELSDLVYDYGVINTTTTFTIISGGNQKEINKSIDDLLKSTNDNKVDKIDYTRAPGYAVTSGTNTAYTITTNPTPTAYVDGMQIIIVPHVDCGANPTLNWNGLGTGTILNQDGTAINAGDIKANKPLSLVRVGSNFFIRSASKSSYFDRLYTQNPWKYCGVLPRARIGSVCEIVNGKLFIFGGTDYTTVVDVLDIATNTWTTATSMPYGVKNAASVQWNNKIYIIGGATSSGVGPVQIYDIASNTWTTAAAGPYIGSLGIAEVYNGKIYCTSSYGSYDILSIYDITSNTWTTGATMPSGQGRINACSGIVNGVIYIIGGSNSTNYTNVLAYTISTNSWTIFCNTPASVSGTVLPLIYGGADAYNGKIYVIGGQNKTSTYNPYENQLWILDTTAKTWTRGIGMPTGRTYPAVCISDKKLFAAGGETTIIMDNMRLEICVLG